ncbi:MAG: hypothetical protein EGR83_20385 [Bacteroides cellulosilyticus]|nr:hypothetical protein [Bacteroides cellulosilyticus]
MRKLLLAWSLFIYGLLFSCTSKDASEIFDRVENYMETCPDSALLLLNQIPQSEKLQGKECADYALLLTQARDKNYLDSLQSDSLIKLAVDYYQDSDDKVRGGKALFYYGKVIALQGDNEKAMQAYLDAQERLEGTKEYKLQAWIQEYVGRINDDQERYDMALDNYQKSIFYNRKAGNTLGIVYAYRNIAWIYEVRQNLDSVNWYVEAGFSLLNGDSTSSVFPSLMHIKGVAESSRGNYLNAVNYFLAAVKCERVTDSLPYYYMSLGDAYMKLGLFDKAEECFKNILSSKDIFALSGAYNYFYLLEKEKMESGKSLYYKEISDSLLQIAKNETKRNKVLNVQIKNKIEKLQKEKDVLRQDNLIQLLGGILLILLFLLILFSYKKKVKCNEQDYRESLQKYMKQNKDVIAVNEQLINQYISQIEELKRKEELIVGASKEQIAKLELEIQILMEKNRVILEDSCADGLNILKQLKERLLIVENMTTIEKQQFLGYIDLLFDNFVTRLCTKYGLKESNLLLAAFIKLGFSSEELVILFDSELEAIRKRKQRLKNKLGLDNKVNLDVFLAYYPRKMSC